MYSLNNNNLPLLGVGVVVGRVEGTVVEGQGGPGPAETSGYISEDADNMDQSDTTSKYSRLFLCILRAP